MMISSVVSFKLDSYYVLVGYLVIILMGLVAHDARINESITNFKGVLFITF